MCGGLENAKEWFSRHGCMRLFGLVAKLSEARASRPLLPRPEIIVEAVLRQPNNAGSNFRTVPCKRRRGARHNVATGPGRHPADAPCGGTAPPRPLMRAPRVFARGRRRRGGCPDAGSPRPRRWRARRSKKLNARLVARRRPDRRPRRPRSREIPSPGRRRHAPAFRLVLLVVREPRRR